MVEERLDYEILLMYLTGRNSHSILLGILSRTRHLEEKKKIEMKSGYYASQNVWRDRSAHEQFAYALYSILEASHHHHSGIAEHV